MAEKNYWNAVMKEVLYGEIQRCYKFTNVSCIRAKASKQHKITLKSKKEEYFIGDIRITKREAECLRQLMRGKTLKGVAEYLKLSPRTVEYYVKNLRKKTHCHRKADLIEMALEHQFQ